MWCCAPLPGLVIALLLGSTAYFLYSPVPEDVTEPNMLRALSASFSLIRLLGSVSETLGFSSSLNFTRAALAYISNDRVTSKSDPELEVTDTTFDGVVVRIYRPKAALHPAPALVYFHGGGFVFMNIDSTDSNTAYIAKAANIVVVSVEYRLAPEHPFPIPFEDCLHATTHLLHNAAKYGVDPKRVAVGGDSAGGNLAAAIALRLSEEPEDYIPRLKLQVLVYPATQSLSFNLPSYKQNKHVGILSDAAVVTFWLLYMGRSQDIAKLTPIFLANNHTSPLLKLSEYGQYVNPSTLSPEFLPPEGIKPYANGLGDEDLSRELEPLLLNHYAAPLMAPRLDGLPRAVFFLADKDVLRDEGLLYYKRLREAGVPVHLELDKSAFHGCFYMEFEIGRRWTDKFSKYLVKYL